MAWWRKKNEGFDWHAYVRTTILARRNDRRARLEKVQQSAVDQAKAAGQALAGGSASAARSAGQGLAAGLRSVFSGLFGMLGGIGRILGGGAPRAELGPLLGVLALFAMGAGSYRAWTGGLDLEALVPLIVGGVLFLFALPALYERAKPRLPASVAAFDPRFAYGLAALLVVGSGAVSAAYVMGQRVAGLSSPLSGLSGRFMPGRSQDVSGRVATVINGETLRVNNTLIRLEGVEAPDRSQSCQGQGKKRWKCGEMAQVALERLTRGKTLKCQVGPTPDALGRLNGTCALEDGRDVGALLVEGGHVFSTSSYFGGYAVQENEAKRQKLSIWANDIERPAEYRAKLWDSAKLTAPEGCPIKGTVTSAGKLYVLPWSSEYAKATVRPQRGERWFCSEGEAQAAGWRSSDRG